eukprot:7745506-Alexandrium_andersonii.AAC.1
MVPCGLELGHCAVERRAQLDVLPRGVQARVSRGSLIGPLPVAPHCWPLLSGGGVQGTGPMVRRSLAFAQ